MNKRLKIIGIAVTLLIMLLLIYLFLTTAVFSFYSVKTSDMAPFFEEKDLIYISKTAYNKAEPKRGDIILFTSAEEGELLSRVIGLPGDLVQIRNGNLYINDVLIQENYLAAAPEYPDPAYEYSTVVPLNYYFVLCDDRTCENDSRNADIGFIDLLSVKGKAVRILSPKSHAGIITDGALTNEN